MSRFKFVLTCKDDQPKLKQEDFEKVKDQVQVLVLINNTEPLAKAYNRILREVRQDHTADFVAFVHGDVNFDVQSFISHVEECKEKYDLIGLCGTEVANVSQSPLNWYTSSNPTPNKRWGCVTHGEIGDIKSFFSKDRNETRDHEVALIDGLCICFGPKALKSSLEFDELFKFDQYDTDISLQALMKYGLKVGVVVEESLVHYSVGRSIQTVQFLIHEIDLRKKWGFGIPKESPIRQIPKELIFKSWQIDGHELKDFSSIDELV